MAGKYKRFLLKTSPSNRPDSLIPVPKSFRQDRQCNTHVAITRQGTLAVPTTLGFLGFHECLEHLWLFIQTFSTEGLLRSNNTNMSVEIAILLSVIAGFQLTLSLGVETLYKVASIGCLWVTIRVRRLLVDHQHHPLVDPVFHVFCLNSDLGGGNAILITAKGIKQAGRLYSSYYEVLS